MTIKVYWQKLDRFGSVRSAYRAANGKLYYPHAVGSLFSDLRDCTKRNNPNTPFDVETCGAVYRIDGRLYICESVYSRVFKPLESFMASISARNPVLAKSTGGGLAKRLDLTVIHRGTVDWPVSSSPS